MSETPANPSATELPVIRFTFTDYTGSPEAAKAVARELAKKLSAECSAIVERDFPGESIRILVTLQ